MLVGEHEWNALGSDMRERGDKNHNLLTRHSLDVAASDDVKQHDRVWREIERNIIAQGSAWRYFHKPSSPLVYQVYVADASKVGIRLHSVSSVHPVVQNPRHIVSVRDPED